MTNPHAFRGTIAEALNIDPDQERAWEIDGVLYVYTPERKSSMTLETLTLETLTRQSISRDAPIDSHFRRAGRLQYLPAGWAVKNAAMFA